MLSTYWLADEFCERVENIDDSEPYHQILVATDALFRLRVNNINKEGVHKKRSAEDDVGEYFHVCNRRRHTVVWRVVVSLTVWNLKCRISLGQYRKQRMWRRRDDGYIRC